LKYFNVKYEILILIVIDIKKKEFNKYLNNWYESNYELKWTIDLVLKKIKFNFLNVVEKKNFFIFIILIFKLYYIF